jgi:hypothetical protein
MWGQKNGRTCASASESGLVVGGVSDWPISAADQARPTDYGLEGIGHPATDRDRSIRRCLDKKTHLAGWAIHQQIFGKKHV